MNLIIHLSFTLQLPYFICPKELICSQYLKDELNKNGQKLVIHALKRVNENSKIILCWAFSVICRDLVFNTVNFDSKIAQQKEQNSFYLNSYLEFDCNSFRKDPRECIWFSRF